MNRLMIDVDDLAQVLEYYDVIKIYRATSETGEYIEITDVETRIIIEEEKEIYYYSDDDGLSTHWYKTSYYNTETEDESVLSSARQGGTEEEKIGYKFDNYSASPNEWGKVLTADDIRHHFLWGVDLVASDEAGSEVEDKQLEADIKVALAEWEQALNIDIRKRVYLTEPSNELLQAREWIKGVDYTDEDDPYDFNVLKWENYGFLQLRHYPIISIEKAEMFSAWDQKIIDILDWIRLHKKKGQINVYPKGNVLHGTGYVGSGLIAAHPYMFGINYPNAFKFNYTTGYKNSDLVPEELRDVIGMLAAIKILGWVGDGLLAGFSSASVSLHNLSESFSSTQSATSAYFGARIKSYIDQIKEFRKHNTYKFANIPIGFVSGR